MNNANKIMSPRGPNIGGGCRWLGCNIPDGVKGHGNFLVNVVSDLDCGTRKLLSAIVRGFFLTQSLKTRGMCLDSSDY